MEGSTGIVIVFSMYLYLVNIINLLGVEFVNHVCCIHNLSFIILPNLSAAVHSLIQSL